MNMPDKKNLVKEFTQSEEFTKFFPDQLVIFKSFEFPKITIQTIYLYDEEKYLKNPSDQEIQTIEYRVNLNYVTDPDYIGPEEEAECIKKLNDQKPFILSIDSLKPLDDKLEDEYLDNFKTIFLKILDLILSNLDKEEIEQLK